MLIVGMGRVGGPDSVPPETANGTSMATVVPTPGLASRRKVPPTSRTRSRMLPVPVPSMPARPLPSSATVTISVSSTRATVTVTLGHLDEFAYALAVELEHGRERGQNVTMNHPLLTGMVVLAHLTEDTLYYARLRVMEAEGELFNLQLKRTPYADLRDQLALLQYAKSLLAARMDEKLAQASA